MRHAPLRMLILKDLFKKKKKSLHVYEGDESKTKKFQPKTTSKEQQEAGSRPKSGYNLQNYKQSKIGIYWSKNLLISTLNAAVAEQHSEKKMRKQ